MKDPNATLPEVDPNEVLEGVHYARLYLQHVLWDRYQMEGWPEQAGMRYALQLLKQLEEGLQASASERDVPQG